MFDNHKWFHNAKIDGDSERTLAGFLAALCPELRVSVNEINILSAAQPTPDSPVLVDPGTFCIAVAVIEQDNDRGTMLVDVFVTPPNTGPCPACKTKGFVFDITEPIAIDESGDVTVTTVEISKCAACEGTGWIWAWLTQMPGQMHPESN